MRMYTQFGKHMLDIFNLTDKKAISLHSNGLNVEEMKEAEVVALSRFLDTHIFEIDTNTKNLLLMTTPPDKNQYLHLPFNSTFVDVKLDKEGLERMGFKKFVYQDKAVEEVLGILIYDQVFTKENNNPKEILGHGLWYYVIYRSDTNRGTCYNLDSFVDNTDIVFEDFNKYKATIDIRKGVKCFVINFLNLVNSPDIELVRVHRDVDRNFKRFKKGKLPLPDSSRIKLTGRLKVYVDKLCSDSKIWHYNHSFWVRGHWRTLRHERWGANRGKRIWIPPFVKGRGILIRKDYEVCKEDN